MYIEFKRNKQRRKGFVIAFLHFHCSQSILPLWRMGNNSKKVKNPNKNKPKANKFQVGSGTPFLLDKLCIAQEHPRLPSWHSAGTESFCSKYPEAQSWQKWVSSLPHLAEELMHYSRLRLGSITQSSSAGGAGMQEETFKGFIASFKSEKFKI